MGERILKILADENVLSVEKSEGDFVFSEACDYYFNIVLSKAEVLQLAEELKELANG